MALPANEADPQAGTRSRRVAQRRRELLDAAVRVIRRQGDQVAMEAIAAEAGISRPILYRHFGDATGLYSAVAHRFLDELLQRLVRVTAEVRSGRALLHRQASTFLGFVAEEPNVYRFLVRNAPPRPGTGSQRNRFSLLVADRSAAYLRDAGWDRDRALMAADLLVGGLEAAADRWLDDQSASPDALAEMATTLLWDGFRAVAIAAAER